ncbi:type II secretion system minor pseudopilin GspI [Parachitinimonas caeni]|uniref:Type II secretion system protein I n=1 Tax=Parachitinimonas caeni TaxID=3031301 RepID=A0ABT7E4K9_9NEIS|nr:type II secretion system minor pseudopilin GspI [Parachitinimonas caeni]MDK2125847.1 type II secretion system minor pseudopilin GspI [Parachitinimonas caeni]
MRPEQRGFTLIEVLVALAVLGIALAAAIRATSGVIDGSIDLRRHLAAGWVAQNRLASYAASSEWPDVGEREGREEQAGMQFTWHESVRETPDRSFRRVEIRVKADGAQNDSATLVGFLAHIKRQQ